MLLTERHQRQATIGAASLPVRALSLQQRQDSPDGRARADPARFPWRTPAVRQPTQHQPRAQRLVYAPLAPRNIDRVSHDKKLP